MSEVAYDRQERSVQLLLDKYETKQPGEIWNKEKETSTKREWRIKQKVRFADYVLNELNMKGIQREQVKHMLNNIKDLKVLCRKCSYEKTITVICFYIKYCTTPKIALNHFNRYKVCREQKITLELYCQIVTNIAKYFQSNTPISALCHV